jgi:hypothetical protein
MPIKEKATAWVTTRFVGFHLWPDAPRARDYIGRRHRHVFHVQVQVDVFHDDREVEFHDLLDLVNDAVGALGEPLSGGARDLGAMSCEMIARHLAEAIREQLPGRRIMVDVSEDGEVGAGVLLS